MFWSQDRKTVLLLPGLGSGFEIGVLDSSS